MVTTSYSYIFVALKASMKDMLRVHCFSFPLLCHPGPAGLSIVHTKGLSSGRPFCLYALNSMNCILKWISGHYTKLQVLQKYSLVSIVLLQYCFNW